MPREAWHAHHSVVLGSLTSVTDVMDPDALLAAHSRTRETQSAALPNGVRAERDGPVVRLVGQFRGFVSTTGDLLLDSAELDALIARQRDYYAARDEAVEWKTWGHDKPTDLPERLRAAGFVAEDRETVVVGLAEQMARHDAPLPAGVLVRQVTELADLRRVAQMKSAVWQRDWSWLAEELSSRIAADPTQIVVLVAEVDHEAVSAGWLVFQPGTDFAGLWGGATAPEWRGRGIYRALVARRARLAAARGTRYLQVDASDDSRPILERLGFTAITTTTPYVWKPSP